MRDLDRLSEQLHWLFDTVPGPAGRLMTTKEVAVGARQLAGVEVSETYINAMKQGRQRNPSAVKLGAIALVFSVPTDFFLRSDVERQVRLLMDELTRAKRAEAESLMDGAISADARRRLAASLDGSQRPSSPR